MLKVLSFLIVLFITFIHSSEERLEQAGFFEPEYGEPYMTYRKVQTPKQLTPKPLTKVQLIGNQYLDKLEKMPSQWPSEKQQQDLILNEIGKDFAIEYQKMLQSNTSEAKELKEYNKLMIEVRVTLDSFKMKEEAAKKIIEQQQNVLERGIQELLKQQPKARL